MNIHGETEHHGKKSIKYPDGTEARTQLIRLRREMKEAIDEEDYERASNCATTFARSKSPQKEIAPQAQTPRRAVWNIHVGPQRSSANQRRMAAGLRPRERYRHLQPHSPGRNLAEFPFISRASQNDRVEIEAILRDRILQVQESGELEYVNVNDLKVIDRQFLVERQLISREHAESEGARGVAIARNEQVSLMINEEDHLRIQVMHSGLDLAGSLGTDRPHRRAARRAW